MKQPTPKQIDANLKRKAKKLLRELEQLPDEAWELFPHFTPEMRKVFVLQLRDVSERGIRALRWEPKQ